MSDVGVSGVNVTDFLQAHRIILTDMFKHAGVMDYFNYGGMHGDSRQLIIF